MAPEQTTTAESLAFWHELIPEAEAARFLGVGRRTLEEWRRAGRGPEPFRLGERIVRYRRLDLRMWTETAR